NPQITAQPQGSTISQGNSAFLSVTATGTNPTYQWFIGTSPSGSLVPGGTSSTLTVSPSSNTNYFVRVTACSNSVDSTTATVTVGACTSPVISNAGANPTNIQAGGSAVLSATVSGSVASTQWYKGTPPDKSNPVAQSGPTVSVSPTVDTTYWLQATSS